MGTALRAQRTRSSDGRRSSRRRGPKPTAQTGSATATKILQAALEEDCSAHRLGDMACGDPTFAGRVLRWVNSTAFQLSHTIVDVRQAAGLLGVRGLRNLALGMTMSGLVPDGEQARVLLANGLRRAIAARAIAREISSKDADAAFTTGLFLDAGLMIRASDDLDGAAKLAMMPSDHRCLLERAEGLEPHPVVGATLARSYELPTRVVEAIARHHDPEPPEDPLGRVAWCAERIAGTFEGGDIAAQRRIAEQAAQTVGLSSATVSELIRTLPERVVEAAKVFDRDVGPQPTAEELLADANRGLLELNQSYEQMVRALETAIEEKEAMARDLHEANDRLRKLVKTDPLTELPNRRGLTEALDKYLSLAARNDTSVAFAILDLDHFKRVNDTYGHDCGDLVLKAVAQLLPTCFRTSDVVARFGGEEFVVVMPETNQDEAALPLERARLELSKLAIPSPKGPLSITMSAGVAAITGPTCATRRDDLFHAADAALYEAKASGRNRVVRAPGS